AGAMTALSRDAGSYLCNYLCWRASEATAISGGPRLAAFVHVPLVRPLITPSPGAVPHTLGDLILAGEAIVEAAILLARIRRRPFSHYPCYAMHKRPTRSQGYSVVSAPSWPGLSRPSTSSLIKRSKTWMPATSAGMTAEMWCL